jgi:hypothetical protein
MGWFLAGMFVGALVGVLTMGMLVAASEADRRADGGGL